MSQDRKPNLFAKIAGGIRNYFSSGIVTAEQKKKIETKYKIALQKGEMFWPDSIFKDLLVSFGIFILLLVLATFVGIPGEPKADPSDTSYLPRPEWYFLFLFKFLALYGQLPLLGKIEWIAATLIPGAAILGLFLLPILDRNPNRHYSKRMLALSVLAIVLTTIVILTVISDIPTTSVPQGITWDTAFQVSAGMGIPILAALILIGLSFFKKLRPPSTRLVQLGVTGLAVVAMIGFTIPVVMIIPAAKPAETTVANTVTEKIILGQDLYSLNCVECHGADGEGGSYKKEDKDIPVKAIHTQDEMYTREDTTLANIIGYGQPNLGMQPFGKSYGGELSPSEIEYIVTFMRYTWDDRAELPKDAAAGSSIPALAAGEVPSYEVHISKIAKRYCVSCHRPNKTNQNYLMGSYDEILNTGDHKPNVVAGDLNSNLVKMLRLAQGTKLGDIGGAMPPKNSLPENLIQMFEIWVKSGMPNTAADAAKLKAPVEAAPAAGATPAAPVTTPAAPTATVKP